MATEILPRLFVGTREDAEALGDVVPADWTCISVTEYRAAHGRPEELPREPQGSIDAPFMLHRTDRSSALDAIAEEIWWSSFCGKKTLVHCVHAHERSPLAIAWYLVWLGKAADIVAAYALIQAVHPSAERRDHWLMSPPKCRLTVAAEALDEIERLREALRQLRGF